MTPAAAYALTPPSLLRNATAPNRGGLGKEGKLYEMPRAPPTSGGCRRKATGGLYRGAAARKRCREVCSLREASSPSPSLLAQCHLSRRERQGRPGLQLQLPSVMSWLPLRGSWQSRKALTERVSRFTLPPQGCPWGRHPGRSGPSGPRCGPCRSSSG